MIPSIIRRDHILKAIDKVNPDKIPNNRRSRDFCLVYENTNYPPKYLISLGHEIATGSSEKT